jgi:hypothetical protein
VRISGIEGVDGTNGTDGTDGTNGTDGVDGATGPSPVYQGVYSGSKTYFGTTVRVDITKYLGTYYVARSDAGTFSGILPTNTAYWNTFGATFDSVATDLLFASLAYIENLGVQNLKTATTGQRIEMTAASNSMMFYDNTGALVVLIDDNIIINQPGISMDNGVYVTASAGLQSLIQPTSIVSSSSTKSTSIKSDRVNFNANSNDQYLYIDSLGRLRFVDKNNVDHIVVSV